MYKPEISNNLTINSIETVKLCTHAGILLGLICAGCYVINVVSTKFIEYKKISSDILSMTNDQVTEMGEKMGIIMKATLKPLFNLTPINEHNIETTVLCVEEIPNDGQVSIQC